MTGSPNEPGAAELLPGEPEEPEAEVEVEAETDDRRPRVITVAFWLLITSCVFWVLVSGSSPPAEQQGTVWIHGVYIWATARIRRGRWTARIIATAAAVWFLVVLGSRAPGFMDPESPFGWGYAVGDFCAVVLTGTGVALLYGREGNTFFRRRPW